MIIENRSQLHDAVKTMKVGQWLKVNPGSFKMFWPDPQWPRDDDHLSVEERSQKWLFARGLTAWEGPDVLTIERLK